MLYAFVGRMPDGIASIAALRVAFDFSSMFQQAANQFRHFFVTSGLDDLSAKRRFMGLVFCAGITVLLLVVLTPLADWLLGEPAERCAKGPGRAALLSNTPPTPHGSPAKLEVRP